MIVLGCKLHDNDDDKGVCVFGGYTTKKQQQTPRVLMKKDEWKKMQNSLFLLFCLFSLKGILSISNMIELNFFVLFLLV